MSSSSWGGIDLVGVESVVGGMATVGDAKSLAVVPSGSAVLEPSVGDVQPLPRPTFARHCRRTLVRLAGTGQWARSWEPAKQQYS